MKLSTKDIKALGLVLVSLSLLACGADEQPQTPSLATQVPQTTPISGSDNDTVDVTSDSIPDNNIFANVDGEISYTKLTNRHSDCAEYAGEYYAKIHDLQQNVILNNQLKVSVNDTHCLFESNNIPQHDVGGNTTTGKDFASRVAENSTPYQLKVPRNPSLSDTVHYIEKQAGKLTLNGILLNGVDLDMDSAFCYHPDISAPLNIGLGTRQQCGLNAEWYAVPANNPDIVTLDEFTGHAFDGRYHYHGDNQALSYHSHQPHSDITGQSDVDPSGSPVIGFAPDGYPIFGHYVYDVELGGVRKVSSSWQTKEGERAPPQGASITPPSITTHPRGLFVEDWQYVEGSGDLDECNGMTDAYGNYGYYYTETYPFGPVCTRGVPDPSFTVDASAFNSG